MVRSLPGVPAMNPPPWSRCVESRLPDPTRDLAVGCWDGRAGTRVRTRFREWAGSGVVALVDVGDAVGVAVVLLELGDLLVVRVAQPQHDRGEDRGDQGPHEHGQLDVVVALGALSEGQFTDEQGDREADPGEQGEAEDIAPTQPFVEPWPG